MPKEKPAVAEKSNSALNRQHESTSDVEMSVSQNMNTASEQPDAGAAPFVEGVEGQSGARVDIEGGADPSDADVKRNPT